MHDLSYKERYPVAFPELSPTQMTTIEKIAKCTTYMDGEVLLKAGERGFLYHVIKKGVIEVIDHSGDEPKVLLVHEANEFTGDLANLGGRASNLSAVAKGTVEVYEIRPDELQQIISEQHDLGETILKAFIARSDALKESDFTGIRIIGLQFSPDTFRIRRFLAKNKVLSTWINADNNPEVSEFLQAFGIQESDMPVVANGNKWLLRNPSNFDLARKTGIMQAFKKDVYDLVIVGAGPAGLAAAVYGASEGLNTVALEKLAPGGQASTSSKIENYLGFPTGISGAELASRATIQAEKFGAQISIPSGVNGLTFENDHQIVHLQTGEKIVSKALIIASGAEYRKLQVSNLGKFEGKGVFYAATSLEETLCSGQQVAIAGGGNSAGQAAMFLASTVRKIFLLIRGDDIGLKMSHYLSQRILENKNIQVFTSTEITALHGDTNLESLEIINNKTNEKQKINVVSLFSFIGALPQTQWLPPEVDKDEKGFIKTGMAVAKSVHWREKRQPFLLETSHPGVFAVGDVRSEASKRVSAAVGEGSMAVQFVHEYLKDWQRVHKSEDA